MYCESLTRKQLKEMGFTNVEFDEKTSTYIIHRYWYKNNSKTKMYDHTIKITVNEKYHPHSGNLKKYAKLTWNYGGKGYCTTLNRFLIAWCRGRINAYKVAHHIDNESLNNDLKNLRAKSIKGNNNDRFKDHPGHTCFNQFKNTGKK